MLAGQDVICLASQSWGSHWCTPQQICSRLAENCRVLYVEPLRSPLWRVRKAATQSTEPPGPPRQVAANLWVLTLPPVFIPLALYRRVPMLRQFNNFVMSHLVKRAADSLGFRNALVWVYMITHEGAPLLDRSPLTVYDCIDEWAGATSDPRLKRYFAQLDRQLCMKADVLFLGSSQLAAPRRALNDCHALVPQGVELAHFLPPTDPMSATPSDVHGLKKPIIGLVGVLNRERIDIELLCHLARSRPQWSIVLVGPVWEGLDTAALARCENIHLLGNKPREVLGQYLSAFDVCMLPYLINDFTRNIFPLKLFEYLASGKPFVSTPIPSCAEFPRLIRTAADHDAFLLAVDDALAERDTALRDERIASAQANDWSRRVAEKSSFVSRRLARRGASIASITDLATRKTI
jgi:glycosyltransferase involved in cell wall biosynthesis